MVVRMEKGESRDWMRVDRTYRLIGNRRDESEGSINYSLLPL